MAAEWATPHWPEGVPRTVSGYDRPLFTYLDEAAAGFPQRAYTVFGGARRTYAEVKDAAERVAHFLASRGVRPGDRVALFLPNLPHYPPIFFGVLKAGAVAVTCNPLYTHQELQHQLKDCGARVLFCMDHPRMYPTAVRSVQGTAIETVVYCGIASCLPPLKALLGRLFGKIPRAQRHEPGHLRYEDVLRAAEPQAPRIEVRPSADTALILYTGGTTGVPRGACLTHSNIASNLACIHEWLRFPHEPGGPAEPQRRGFHTYLGVLPWYHVFGLTCTLLSACASASRLICVPDPRAGRPPFTEVLKLVERERPTLMPAVPTIFIAFLNHPHLERYDLTSLMGCFSGGAPMPPEVCHRFEEKTGAVVFEGYGLSETAPVVTANPTNPRQRRIGSIGFPLPGTDVKIVDLVSGSEELPRGADGELAISGPQVMPHYWRRPEEDEKVFRQLGGRRYLLTGDVGHVDEEGYIHITDRKKDLILVGGFNVYPRDVEDILFRHPKVAVAAVVGVPDARSGEAVKAFIQLRPGETATVEEILEFCRENMAGYKRPRQIEFRDTLPMSNVGKVLRRLLRSPEAAKQTGGDRAA